jgi:hypothetical protein
MFIEPKRPRGTQVNLSSKQLARLAVGRIQEVPNRDVRDNASSAKQRMSPFKLRAFSHDACNKSDPVKGGGGRVQRRRETSTRVATHLFRLWRRPPTIPTAMTSTGPCARSLGLAPPSLSLAYCSPCSCQRRAYKPALTETVLTICTACRRVVRLLSLGSTSHFPHFPRCISHL